MVLYTYVSRGLGVFAFVASILFRMPTVVRCQNYAALELSEGANEIEVQVAYKATLAKLIPLRDTDEDSVIKLAEAQEAYESLSDGHMRDEAVGFVDYWSEVEYLSSDEDLRRFADLLPGGSTRLRVIFVESRPDTKVFEAYAAAIRLSGRVKVAQLCHSSMVDARGQLGRLYSSLKVSENGVILIDPLSQGKKVTYERNGLGRDIERLLSGSTAMSKLARIQEFDARAYQARCPPSAQCSWSLVVATDHSFEEKRGELNVVLKEFSDACKALQVPDKYPWLACFWLRLNRSEKWRDELFRNGVQANDGKPVIFAWRRDPSNIIIPNPGEVFVERTISTQLSTQEQARWATFDGTAYYSVGICRFADRIMPESPDGFARPFSALALPPPLRKDEEPRETPMERVMRYSSNIVDCLNDHQCIMDALERGMLAAGIIGPGSSDMEKNTLMVGCVIFIFMLSCFCCFKGCCCCGCSKRRPVKLDESQVLRNMHMLLTVPLNRVSKEAKYGLNIDPSNEGGLLVNDIVPGHLVDKWNALQSEEASKVRRGDRIVSIVVLSGAKQTVCTSVSAMKQAFGNDNLLLTVEANRAENEVVRVASTLSIDKNTLQSKGFSFAEFDLTKEAQLSEVANSQAGFQVTGIGAQVEEWNAKARADGCCCSQIIEVGDRVVISPKHVLNCKLRLPTQVQTDGFEVTVVKNGPEDRLGMQIRTSPCSLAHMEVLDVLDGAVKRACQGQGRMVQRGDRLVSANGQVGPEAMGQQFRAEQVVLRFERWVDRKGQALLGNVPAAAAAPTFGSGSVAPPQAGLAKTMQADAAKALPAQAAPQPPSAVQQPSFGGHAMPATAPQPALAPVPSAAPSPPSHVPSPTAAPAVAGDGASVCGKILLVTFVVAFGAWVVVFGREPPPQLRALPKAAGMLARPMPESSRQFMDQINPSLYCDIGISLIIAGAMLTVNFVAYELAMLRRAHERRLLSQLCVASVASNFLGFGIFFLLTWAGVYV